MSDRHVWTCDNCKQDIANEDLVFRIEFNHINCNPTPFKGEQEPDLPSHICLVCMVTLWGAKPTGTKP